MLKYKHDIVSLIKIYIKMFSLKYMYSEIINYIYFFEALDLVLAFYTYKITLNKLKEKWQCIVRFPGKT